MRSTEIKICKARLSEQFGVVLETGNKTEKGYDVWEPNCFLL